MHVYSVRTAGLILLFAYLFLESCGPGTPLPANSAKTDHESKPETGLTHRDSVELDFKNRIERIPLGDLNGDGISDTAIVFPPRYLAPGNPVEGCENDSCDCRIHFTCKFPDLKGILGIGEVMANVGDLDGNGYCEVALVPEWFTSVWQGLYVYGLRDGKWQLFAQGTCNLNELYADSDFFKNRVKKIDNSHVKIISDSLTADSSALSSRIWLIK